MRPLIISALAATLIGCTSSAPQQAQQASLYSATDAPQMDSNTGANAEKVIHAKTEHPRHRRNANSGTKIAKVSVPKMDTSSRVQPDDKSSTSINAQSTTAPKTQTQQTAQPIDKSGTSINAQSTAAAKTQTQQTVQPVDKSGTSFNAQSTAAAKTQTQQTAQPVDKSSTSFNAQSTAAAKTQTQQTVQPVDKSGTSINAQSTAAAKTQTQQTVQPVDKSSTSFNAQSTAAAKTQTQQTTQPDSKSDAVLTKAMSAIAAKMQNSASVELVEMKRAEKNAPGKSIDTICGYVRGKSASGLDTGDRPFLYLVQEDKAYIGLYDIVTSPYHNLCDK